MLQCQHKNVMICKTCLATGLRGITLHKVDGGYHVYCFSSGMMTLQVSSKAVVTLSHCTCACQARMRDQRRFLSASQALLEGFQMCCHETPKCSTLQTHFGKLASSAVHFQGDGGEPWLL